MPNTVFLALTSRTPTGLLPILNVQRRAEPVATDTVYASTPAGDCGVTSAHSILAGTWSEMSSPWQPTSSLSTLPWKIFRKGAMTKLISDSAKLEISARVKDVLRAFIIDDWQSEAILSTRTLLNEDTKTPSLMST
jgi:hypothetical protein